MDPRPASEHREDNGESDALANVAILSPGDMGHAVGRALGDGGLNVVTCLAGRSKRTRELARRAGIRSVPSMEEMVVEADLVLSILVPSEAVGVARQIAGALRASGAHTAFADCNAVSPQSARAMSDIIAAAGGWFIDASIIGPPPGRGESPRLYVSGDLAHMMELGYTCHIADDLFLE